MKRMVQPSKGPTGSQHMAAPSATGLEMVAAEGYRPIAASEPALRSDCVWHGGVNL